MGATYYALSSYNSKKRDWEHETTSQTITAAKKRAKSESKMTGKRWRIVKETIVAVFLDGKDVSK